MLKVANSVISASRITGVLPVVNGGTGVTTSTGTGNTVLSVSPTFTGTAVFGTLSGGTSGTGYSFSGSAPATSLTLNSSGVLLVGGTTANFSSAGRGDIEINGTSESLLGFNRASAGSAYIWATSSSFRIINKEATPLTFATTEIERMRIDATGIVTMNAYGAGAATFSSAGVISSVSDETWKIKDGEPVDPDAMLKKLEPGYWYYNDEKKETFGTDRQLGFYAQNVNAAIGPEAAPEPEEGKPWGYYDRAVLAVTVMSLKKAIAIIESLTFRIATLENK